VYVLDAIQVSALGMKGRKARRFDLSDAEVASVFPNHIFAAILLFA
jgi:hypothetical protein